MPTRNVNFIIRTGAVDETVCYAATLFQAENVAVALAKFYGRARIERAGSGQVIKGWDRQSDGETLRLTDGKWFAGK